MNNIAIFLENRYRILDVLGEGGCGKTYRAVDEACQAEVAIKVLNLRGMSDWKTLELFDREAKILAQLEHPAIPRYLDFFQTEIAGEEVFCLVQAIAPGRSLASWIESGYIFNSIELRNIATQILEILIYLQTFTPPIIHRDLKPQNLIWRESGNIYLIDFGAVRDTYHLTVTGGSTIVGTYGYMAPEQFRGQAVLATDLYGLGTTLLYLASGKDPADFPIEQMKIDFRDALSDRLHQRVKISPNFIDWLDGLLEPIPEDRYRSAARALAALNGKNTVKTRHPKHPITQIERQGETMKIVILPIWLKTDRSQRHFFTAISLILLAIGIFGLMTSASLNQIPGLFCLCLLLEIVLISGSIRILWHYYNNVRCQHEIEITKQNVICTTKIDEVSISQRIIKLKDIEHVNCPKISRLNFKSGIELSVSTKRHFQLKCDEEETTFLPLYTFGRYLDRAEKIWLACEILEQIQYLDPETDRIFY
ncbi:serine/threonine-protein kinase [Chamaesiphon sp. VAR_48_metabat_403]|uniref:serine/threonine protein kinase n=1 Tax=Chamaesiphon sp. VAR_48_metabat_403 TaxID=2964700 RepID=UPI00286E414C|nr:serine/threonine-protein kinase [Chamaesiphon sp. VAR_48_metabat_403]